MRAEVERAKILPGLVGSFGHLPLGWVSFEDGDQFVEYWVVHVINIRFLFFFFQWATDSHLALPITFRARLQKLSDHLIELDLAHISLYLGQDPSLLFMELFIQDFRLQLELPANFLGVFLQGHCLILRSLQLGGILEFLVPFLNLLAVCAFELLVVLDCFQQVGYGILQLLFWGEADILGFHFN